jgi:hypothetical protein
LLPDNRVIRMRPAASPPGSTRPNLRRCGHRPGCSWSPRSTANRSAATATSRVTQLETNHTLPEAIALYQAAGYRQVAPFSDEPYATHWFEKTI